MNNFEDVYGLNRDDRQMSNLETYRRFISKGDKPLQCINDEDAKAIKDVLSGKGKLLAVVDGRRSMAGNHKYVLFVKEEGGVKVYLYTVLNGLYNDMGPYKDLDTAMSNADCYGLFEECKRVANKKVLNESIEDEEEFDDWDDLGYDDVTDEEMTDVPSYDRDTAYETSLLSDMKPMGTPKDDESADYNSLYTGYTDPNPEDWEGFESEWMTSAPKPLGRNRFEVGHPTLAGVGEGHDYEGGYAEIVDYDPFEEI